MKLEIKLDMMERLEITYEFLDIVGPAKLARLSKARREIRKV